MDIDDNDGILIYPDVDKKIETISSILYMIVKQMENIYKYNLNTKIIKIDIKDITYDNDDMEYILRCLHVINDYIDRFNDSDKVIRLDTMNKLYSFLFTTN